MQLMARKLDCDLPVPPRHLGGTAALDPDQTGEIGGAFRAGRRLWNSRMM